MKPNSTITTMKRNFSLVTMSPGFNASISLAEQVAILGLRAAAKSVRWRHMHCVESPAETQPPPLNDCLMLSQEQL